MQENNHMDGRHYEEDALSHGNETRDLLLKLPARLDKAMMMVNLRANRPAWSAWRTKDTESKHIPAKQGEQPGNQQEFIDRCS
jgi:hypothetical protein